MGWGFIAKENVDGIADVAHAEYTDQPTAMSTSLN